MQTNDVETIDATRHPLTVAQLREMMGWSFGGEGELMADLWQGFNQQLWDSTLKPCPLFFPRATTYGSWIGLFTRNLSGMSLHIQLKHSMTTQQKADVLLQEMVHQALSESRRDTSHNAKPWCEEIMRLTAKLWQQDIWASPSEPRKVEGRSVRIQKPSATGTQSISRTAIASWPDSLGLHVPINRFVATSSIG